MKTLRISSILALLIALVQFSFAQKTSSVTTQSIPVSGNCGMCKKTIEKAAKEAGAATAKWDMEKKVLSVSFNSLSTSAAKIQQSVAASGYDTRDVKADDKAYDALHECCKYERKSTEAKVACCDNDKCGKADNCCSGMDCCKSGTCKKQS